MTLGQGCSSLAGHRRMFSGGNAIRPLGPGGQGVSLKLCEKLVRAVLQQGFRPEVSRGLVGRSDDKLAAAVDVLVAGPGEPRLPDEVFHKLRWGGLFICVGVTGSKIERMAQEFDGKRGFVLERPPTYFWIAPLGLRLPLPGVATKAFYFVARKTQLIQPGDFTERFTYHVELVPDATAEHGHVVSKRVPTVDEVLNKLRHKFPDAEPTDLEKRAGKFVDHIFPTFLTREAAILKILQRDLPAEFRDRVPTPLSIEQDDKGMVQHLRMNWLRMGGQTLSQLDFARQACELLYILHERGQVMHLDLRMDNIVITDQGVSFVDFGSAVRIGENLRQSPMLTTLFTEMMRTSHIQRMLGKMLDTGECTSRVMKDIHGKVDKNVDAFYLAVQIARPDTHPEMRHLIRYDADSAEARMLAALTAAILRPKNPGKEHYKTVADILRGIRRIEQKLAGRARTPLRNAA
jgi:hypothetical protein